MRASKHPNTVNPSFSTTRRKRALFMLSKPQHSGQGLTSALFQDTTRQTSFRRRALVRSASGTDSSQQVWAGLVGRMVFQHHGQTSFRRRAICGLLSSPNTLEGQGTSSASGTESSQHGGQGSSDLFQHHPTNKF